MCPKYLTFIGENYLMRRHVKDHIKGLLIWILLLTAMMFLGCIGQEQDVKPETTSLDVETTVETAVEIKIETTMETTTQEENDPFAEARSKMVRIHLKGRDINDSRVLEVMGRIPRHLFVDEKYSEDAYADHPLPIAEGQTISQPYVVALMTQALQLKGSERVLEIGTGSGYQAAVLAELCEEVYTIEIRETLATSAKERLLQLGYENVHVKWADGYFGWEEYAPYDCIIITCAVNHIPPALLQQLNDGGRLILPLGSTLYYQTLTLVEKQNNEFILTHIIDVRFVPMVGEAQTGEPPQSTVTQPELKVYLQNSFW